MHRTMMPAAEWDRELIADLAAERAGLGKSEVVGVRWLAAADETRLLGDIAKVVTVAIAPRGSDGEHALIEGGLTFAYATLPAGAPGHAQVRPIFFVRAGLDHGFLYGAGSLIKVNRTSRNNRASWYRDGDPSKSLRQQDFSGRQRQLTREVLALDRP
jgi:hypothetical protein